MKIQPLMALVVLSLPTGPGVRAAIREFKARTLGLLALACLLVAAPATAQVNYAVSGNTAYVTESPNASGDIVIASTFNGYPVTVIGIFAFSRCTNLTSVTIPNSVTIIANTVFYDCINLTNVIIGNSVASIGEFAFSGCTSLTSVTIPNSVTSIKGLAFARCTSLTSVIIGNSVTSIEGGAFSGCTSLTNLSVDAANPVYSSLDGVLFDKAQTTLITFPPGRSGSYVIPDSVTSIEGNAFSGTSLTSVTIGNSVTSGDAAFGRTSLTNLSVAAANPVYGSLDGVLFDKAQTTLIIFPPGRGGSYVIPNSVTSIGQQAFYGCTSLTNVTIPNSVASIGDRAFENCISLTSVTIGNSVTSIGDRAFSGCTSLTSVTIPNSVTIIGDAAFSNCTNLTNFTFLGNAPSLIPDWHVGGFTQFASVGPGAKAYYYCGTTGWGTNYAGLPTVMLCAPQIAPGSAGVKPGGFGFTLTSLTNQTIVVEASVNLVNWQPIWTNALPGASAEFVDPEWLQHSNRFYRARSD